jgi:UDP-glucose 4-epimerase
MTVLITGSGLIGSYVAQQLVDRGEMPVLFDAAPRIDCISDVLDINKIKLVRGSILDFPHLLEVVKNEGADRIVHTAAMLNIPRRVESPFLGVKVNIEGTLNILEIARIMDLEKVVFSSSAVVYFGSEKMKGKTCKEDFPLMMLSGRPKSTYSTTKIAGEFLGLNYADDYGLDFVAVRYAAAFGPWKCPHAPQILLIRELVEKPLQGKIATIDATHTWSGRQEFVYIKDAASGTILACDVKNPETRVYNIGMGKTVEFNELVSVVKKLIPGAKINVMGMSEGIFGLPYTSEGKPLDLTKSREELGYRPKYDMETSIADYIEWAKLHMN